MQAQLSNLTTPELLLLASQFLSMGLGLAISYIAYRGYRRNDSRPMLFIAIGFVLIVGVGGLLGGLNLFFGVGDPLLVAGVIQASEITGMAAILYAIRMNPR